jgi:hypothetical protein
VDRTGHLGKRGIQAFKAVPRPVIEGFIELSEAQRRAVIESPFLGELGEAHEFRGMPVQRSAGDAFSQLAERAKVVATELEHLTINAIHGISSIGTNPDWFWERRDSCGRRCGNLLGIWESDPISREMRTGACLGEAKRPQ